VLLISRAFGIEDRKLLRPEDDYEALKEFNQSYEGTTSAVEEMHLEYQRLLDEIPGLAETLERIPGAVFSGKERPKKGTPRRLLLLQPAGSRYGEGRVYRGGWNDPLVLL
jgi:hypothetical protein